MRFWAIANTQEEDTFYDFLAKGDVSGFSETALLPTEEMANTFIEDELSVNYISIPVTIEVVEAGGSWSYTHAEVKEWNGGRFDPLTALVESKNESSLYVECPGSEATHVEVLPDEDNYTELSELTIGKIYEILKDEQDEEMIRADDDVLLCSFSLYTEVKWLKKVNAKNN